MKYKELTTKSDAELGKELSVLREEIRKLALKVKLGEVKNTHALKQHRKDTARILTLLSNRAL
jgi:ribosomal protein L29